MMTRLAGEPAIFLGIVFCLREFRDVEGGVAERHQLAPVGAVRLCRRIADPMTRELPIASPINGPLFHRQKLAQYVAIVTRRILVHKGWDFDAPDTWPDCWTR